MKPTKLFSALFCSLLLGATAYAASVSGTVTNKTTDKPSAGDKVELVDVQAGMSAVATATTNSSGKYTLNEPGAGPYLVRVTHQGAQYFIAAPQGAGPGDITVYDASPSVSAVSLEDQIINLEAPNGQQLEITEQYVVHNSSSPKTTKSGNNTFEFALPDGAIIDMAEATRPSGLPTMAQPSPAGTKNHYAFNTPIEPDQGPDKMTVFQVHYHLPYTGKYTFKPTVSMPTSNLAVQLPKSMTFAAGSGASYQSIPQDPSIQTYLLKNAQPGAAMEFTVSGTGSMPRDQQQGGGQEAAGPQQGTPGGGIGEPIPSPDPLSKYKFWILGGLGLVLVAAAAFLLRKPAGAPAGATPTPAAGAAPAAYPPATGYPAHVASPAGKNGALLSALKEELFALESDKLSGAIPPAEYAEQKAALETVLKRALQKKS